MGVGLGGIITVGVGVGVNVGVAVGLGDSVAVGVTVGVTVLVGVGLGVGVLLACQSPCTLQPSRIRDHPDIDHVPSVTAPLNEIVTDPIEPVPPIILPFERVN